MSFERRQPFRPHRGLSFDDVMAKLNSMKTSKRS